MEKVKQTCWEMPLTFSFMTTAGKKVRGKAYKFSQHILSIVFECMLVKTDITQLCFAVYLKKEIKSNTRLLSCCVAYVCNLLVIIFYNIKVKL